MLKLYVGSVGGSGATPFLIPTGDNGPLTPLHVHESRRDTVGGADRVRVPPPNLARSLFKGSRRDGGDGRPTSPSSRRWNEITRVMSSRPFLFTRAKAKPSYAEKKNEPADEARTGHDPLRIGTVATIRCNGLIGRNNGADKRTSGKYVLRVRRFHPEVSLFLSLSLTDGCLSRLPFILPAPPPVLPRLIRFRLTAELCANTWRLG